MKTQKGFSLIELLIVVAIILIIAAIAVPQFMRSKISANESSAVAALHSIATAEVSYANSFPTVGYSATLADLGGSATTCATATGATQTNACLLDNVLALANSANNSKSGYYFTYIPAASGGTTFSVQAPPSIPGTTGQRYFFTDQTGVIRYGLNVQPDNTFPAIQ